MNNFSKLNTEEVLNYLPDPIIIVDLLGNIKFANISFAKLLGYDEEELFNKNVIDYLLDASTFDTCISSIECCDVSKDQTTMFLSKNGEHVYTTKSVRLIEIDNKECIFANIRDISKIDKLNLELNSSKRELEEKSKQLTTLLDDHKKQIAAKQLQLDEIVNVIDEIIWYIDDKTMVIKYVSNAIEHIFGEKKEKFLNDATLWMQMIHPQDREKVEDFFYNIQPSESVTVEFRIIQKSGSIKWLSSTVTHHLSLNLFIGVTRDITKDKEAHEKMEFMAFHDTLTQLPNRSFLKNEIDALLQKSTIMKQDFALLFLDLDNFKYINDSMGHDIGDDILIKVADKLTQTIASDEVCTRFGGDEFVIITKMKNQKDIGIKAQKIIDALNQPFIVNDHEFFISSSIGISLYPQDATNATGLIKSADTAMYQAKLSGKNRYSFFDKSMNTNVQEFLKIETLVKDALANNYFELYFQPLIDASKSTLYGFEALLRLIHPEYGFISPDKFIPVAEATSDILKISAFVMKSACQFASEINALSAHDIFVSINISARQFKEKDFAKGFLKCAADNGANPRLLKVEMTESVVMENITLALKELDILKKAGVRIALDDFGTGYSSFEYLAQLPINTIKIDKSFIIPVFDYKSNEHIVMAITSLAHALNMDVIAEGVETIQHVEYLKHNKIDILQGFYYSKAIPANEIIENIGDYKKLFNL